MSIIFFFDIDVKFTTAPHPKHRKQPQPPQVQNTKNVPTRLPERVNPRQTHPQHHPRGRQKAQRVAAATKATSKEAVERRSSVFLKEKKRAKPNNKLEISSPQQITGDNDETTQQSAPETIQKAKRLENKKNKRIEPTR